VIDRFGQIEPKVLITCAGYRYAGKDIDQTAKINEILERLPSLQQLIVVPYAGRRRAEDFRTAANVRCGTTSTNPAASRISSPCPSPTRCTSSIPAAPPACPSASSTAPAACCCNTRKHGLHSDLGPGDRLFYYTTCGWMMWNWLVSALAVGSAVVLYDGSPFHPGPSA
jgi:acetoacetyl-CoA synthetase